MKFSFLLLGLRVVQFLLILVSQAEALDFYFIHFFDNGAESESSNSASAALDLESPSSSASLSTYRNVIAAENEAEIYNRIRNLENHQY